MKRWLILPFLVSFTILALAAPARFTDVGYPGGIVRVAIPTGTVAVFADDRALMHDAQAAIAGVPLTAMPGSGRIFARTALGTVALTYRIEPRAYPEQRLTIANQRMVDPAPDDLRRIDQEQVLIDAARLTFSATAPTTLALRAPVQAPLSSLFGTRRVFNGQPRNPHNGIDFAAPTGSTISTPLAGEVVGIGDYFFTGNTVFVDHGQGLVTMYCHLSRVDVQVGKSLQIGDAIGRVGATGRATGPHLHFAVYLSNVAIDPLLLLSDVATIDTDRD